MHYAILGKLIANIVLHLKRDHIEVEGALLMQMRVYYGNEENKYCTMSGPALLNPWLQVPGSFTLLIIQFILLPRQDMLLI